jgi:hypothetical protein
MFPIAFVAVILFLPSLIYPTNGILLGSRKIRWQYDWCSEKISDPHPGQMNAAGWVPSERRSAFGSCLLSAAVTVSYSSPSQASMIGLEVLLFFLYSLTSKSMFPIAFVAVILFLPSLIYFANGILHRIFA